MNNKFWIIDMPKYSIITFLILNVIAMLLYPGGNINDSSQTGYVFFNNFFSDLGMRFSHSKEDNIISCVLFNFSLCVIGSCFIMLFYSIRNIFVNYKNISLMAALFGMMSGACYIGVAFTPSDIFLDAHIVFAHYIFRLLFIVSIIYGFLIVKTKNFNNKYAYGFIVFGIIVLSYVLTSEVYLEDPRKVPEHLYLHVLAQKMIVFWILISIYIYSLGLGDYLKNKLEN